MYDPSNVLTVGSSSQINDAAPSGPAASSSSSSSAPRASTNVITYSYASRLVYVAPAETYDDAIDIAKESFWELKDVERELIRFEIKVNLVRTQQSSTAEIGRTAWSNVVASLARFEIVENTHRVHGLLWPGWGGTFQFQSFGLWATFLSWKERIFRFADESCSPWVTNPKLAIALTTIRCHSYCKPSYSQVFSSFPLAIPLPVRE